jgi:hypothetical protein
MPTNWTKKVNQEEAFMLANVSETVKWSSNFAQIVVVAENPFAGVS